MTENTKKYLDIIDAIGNETQEVLRSLQSEGAASINTNADNVVSGDILRKIQSNILFDTKQYLSCTFGPMGASTKIVSGSNIDNITSTYSKDGLKVLKNIKNSNPIEASIIEELIDITRNVELKVGDGTTSTVILSSIIFDHLIRINSTYDVPPHVLVKIFKNVVRKICDKILTNKKDCTLEDIFDISKISTNGNDEIAGMIQDIYKEFGMDVDLDIGISNSPDNVVKIYNGLTIKEGMSDPVFINNRANNTCEIRDPQIFYFQDPVDTPDQIALVEAIIAQNIYMPMQNREPSVPTIICCPRVSKDMSSMLKQLSQQLYQFDQKDMSSEKPSICIVTNIVGSDEAIMDDIATLCGCKAIHKYIDPKNFEKDLENGLAATPDTVISFAGHAEMVVSDIKKTKFINPQHMMTVGEDGEEIEDPIYSSMIRFLETEIENAAPSESAAEVGLLKKRLAGLKGNSVDFLVGGITISERDSLKDLVEDAVKNCRSAVENGVGRAANFEGLSASVDLFEEMENTKADENDNTQVKEIEYDILTSILSAYWQISRILYETISIGNNEADEKVGESLSNGMPFNIGNGEFDTGKVSCSIMLDIYILETISKIITMMVTCNQCLLQDPSLNNYS